MAETGGDPTLAVMAHFYGRAPQAQALFERHGLGKRDRLEAEMIELAFYCLMTWPERPDEIRMVFETSIPHHHDTLDVGIDLYRDLLDSLIDVVASSVPVEESLEHANLATLRRELTQAIEATRRLLML